MELRRHFDALAAKGAVWKALRLSRSFLYDTIECTTIIQTDAGVIRGVVEVTRHDNLTRTKAEVTCYLDGKIEEGRFKHNKHPRNQTSKIFEYKDEILNRYKRFLGWTPEKSPSPEHCYLIAMADRLVAEFDKERAARRADEDARREEASDRNKKIANKALFS